MAPDDANNVANDSTSPDVNRAPDPFAEGRAPQRMAHKVARSAPDNDILNTIDFFGEKPFSV